MRHLSSFLSGLTPLFFALDHVNYSRWMPIHIRDMKCLPDSIRDEFERGHWVLSKTKKAFSAIPFDQVHEQENASVKGSGGCDSLKECTRAKRGKGLRRKVSGQTKLPSKWMDFLCDSKNKEELFAFLTTKISESAFPPGNIVYVTSGKSVLHSNTTNSMSNCNHEEADTRIIVHMHHALQQGMRRVEVRSVLFGVMVH